MKHQALSQIPPTEILILSKIAPQEARTLLAFMRTYIPAPKTLNPTMIWEKSHEIRELLDKIRVILSCRAEKEVAR